MIRAATAADVPELLRLVRGLAEYEREPDAVECTEADYAAVLFPSDGEPTAYAHIAEEDGEVVGAAIWYQTFSTWQGPGLWLEDLFVMPEHRGAGHGRALLATLAGIAHERGWKRMEWNVLDWNTPAKDFYDQLGALHLAEWETRRLTGAALADVARLA
ncbi:N-acetyltransferase family protein [Actinomycetota bacterium]